MTTQTVLVTGNTYPVKDALKAMGARWDAVAKGWRVPANKAQQAQALVAGAPQSAPRAGNSGPRYTTRSRSRGARYCDGWGADNPHPPCPPYTCMQCGGD